MHSEVACRGKKMGQNQKSFPYLRPDLTLLTSFFAHKKGIVQLRCITGYTDIKLISAQIYERIYGRHE
jgi:hypothetical protein